MNRITLASRMKCTGCSACLNKCPAKAIEMIPDNEGFLQPVIIESDCIYCGLCVEACPVVNNRLINESNSENVFECYAAFSKNDQILLQSSSGGVFTHIAKHVLINGGIVVGAVFDELLNVEHVLIDNLDELHRLCGSKYVQSKIDYLFKDIENYLTDGQTVLFTGTPCQCAGLKSYLNNEFDNLILCDLICHGVNSPWVYSSYLNELQKNYNSSIKSVSFRDKSSTWKKFGVKICFTNNEVYYSEYDSDPFMLGFVKTKGGYYLRESCFSCNFKGIKRLWSDITLGDFWGIDKIDNSFYNEKGVSLVFLHTQKGHDLFKRISHELQFKEMNSEKAVEYNIHAIKSALRNSKRDSFFDQAKENGFSLQNYIKENL